ncbi:hypothetical protein BH11MYX3_BH11MYX3_20070 [soil metagenome]
MLVRRVVGIGITVALVLVLRRPAQPPSVVVIATPAVEQPTTIIETFCYSCGSGTGPSADELASRVDLAEGENLISINGTPRFGEIPDAIRAVAPYRAHDHRSTSGSAGRTGSAAWCC